MFFCAASGDMNTNPEVHKQAGFTIIEVLISMMIFTALISLLFSGLYQTIQNWDKASQYVSKSQYQLARHNWLERLFSRTLASDFQAGRSGYQAYLEGDEKQIRFLSTAPILDMPETTKPVSLKFKRENNQLALLYGEGKLGDDPQRKIRWDKLTWLPLMENLQSGQFQYEAPANPLPKDEIVTQISDASRMIYRDAAEWFGQYRAADYTTLPQRVLIEFTDKDDIKHKWFFRIYRRTNIWSLEYYE
jgi:prepilin-type N-terminal cleavage/methylation domain-containing protein